MHPFAALPVPDGKVGVHWFGQNSWAFRAPGGQIVMVEFPFFDGCARIVKRIGLQMAVPAHYQCFVKRTYAPEDWAKSIETTGAAARIIGYNSTALLP